MSDIADVKWVATWSCPKCKERCDDADYDIDFDDGLTNVECKELVDKGDLELEACGH
jgi:hypothetical protein